MNAPPRSDRRKAISEKCLVKISDYEINIRAIARCDRGKHKRSDSAVIIEVREDFPRRIEGIFSDKIRLRFSTAASQFGCDSVRPVAFSKC